MVFFLFLYMNSEGAKLITTNFFLPFEQTSPLTTYYNEHREGFYFQNFSTDRIFKIYMYFKNNGHFRLNISRLPQHRS